MSIIERKRREHALTQTELAKFLGVDQTAVSKWEKGIAMPTADKLPRLARILDCTIDQLFDTDDTGCVPAHTDAAVEEIA